MGWRHTHHHTQRNRCCTARPHDLLGPCLPLLGPVRAFRGHPHPCRALGLLYRQPPLAPDPSHPCHHFPLVPDPLLPDRHLPPGRPHGVPCLPRLGHGHPCRPRRDLAHPGLRCPPHVRHAAAAAPQSAQRPSAALAAAGTAAVAAACSHSRVPRGTGAGQYAVGHPHCRCDCRRHRLACQLGLHVHRGPRNESALCHLPTDSAPDIQTSASQTSTSLT